MNYLVIPCVEFPNTVNFNEQHRYVAETFWKQNIAKISDVTLIPYWRNEEVVYVGFITVQEWMDTENAYNFIKKLDNSNKEARIVYDVDDWWVIQLNTINQGNFTVENYTMYFTYVSDFEEFEEEIIVPVIAREIGDYSCAFCNSGTSGPFSLCNNIDCKQYMLPFGDDDFTNAELYFCNTCLTSKPGPYNLCQNKCCSEYVDNKVTLDFLNEDYDLLLADNAVDLDFLNEEDNDDTAPPTLLQVDSKYSCSLCKRPTGSMYSVCRNPDCEWFSLSIYKIVENSLNKDKVVWRQTSPKNVCFDDLPVEIESPLSYHAFDEWDDFSENFCDDTPEFPEEMYECGVCHHKKRNMFSVCWNALCERYGKNVDEIYPENAFNLDTKFVTFRETNKIIE